MVFLFFYLSQAWVEGSLFFFLGDIGGFPMPGGWGWWPALFGPVVLSGLFVRVWSVWPGFWLGVQKKTGRCLRPVPVGWLF